MTPRKNRWLALALRGVVVCLAIVGVTAIFTAQAVSDDPPADAAKKAMDEMHKRFEEMSTPGAHHKHLNALIGDWNTENKFWMGPGDPQVVKGTASYRWIMDGRFVVHEYNSTWDGKPFKGLGYSGYDNLTKKYQNTWLDNMSTSIFVQSGSCDESGRTFTYEGEGPDCMTGKVVQHKSVLRVISSDRHVFEMHKPGPDGKLMKIMEITYTRK